MWSLVSSDDRAVYVGEALGCWAYAIVWPESAGFLLIDDFALRDLRDGTVPDLPLGALSPRLST